MADSILLTLQYVYSNSTGTYLGTTNKIAVNSVRLTIGWVPAALQTAIQGAAAALRQP